MTKDSTASPPEGLDELRDRLKSQESWFEPQYYSLDKRVMITNRELKIGLYERDTIIADLTAA